MVLVQAHTAQPHVSPAMFLNAEVEDPTFGLALHQLLPPGAAWKRVPDSILDLLENSHGQEFRRIQLRAESTRREFKPNTAFELLAEWEALLNRLDCSDADTVAARHAFMLYLFTLLANAGDADIQAIYSDLGLDAPVLSQTSEFKAGDVLGGLMYNEEWPFALQVAKESEQRDALAECRLALIIHNFEIAIHNYTFYLNPNSGGANDWFDVAYDGASTWLAVGQSGDLYTSSGDFSAWTQRTPDAAFAGNFNSVVWDPVGLQFVAVGAGGEIQTSPDGITWNQETTPSAAVMNSVQVDPSGLLIAAGGSGADVIWSSVDGATWVNRSPATANTGLNGVFHNKKGTAGGFWLVVGTSGSIQWSHNGTDWISVASPAVSTLKDVHFCNESIGWLATGDDDDILRSLNGKTGWAVVHSLPAGASPQSISFDGTTAVAHGGQDATVTGIATSIDGINWTDSVASEMLTETKTLWGSIFDGTQTLICAADQTIFTSRRPG